MTAGDGVHVLGAGGEDDRVRSEGGGAMNAWRASELRALDDGTRRSVTARANQSNVIKTDIDASNGVIYTIDAVLIPAQS